MGLGWPAVLAPWVVLRRPRVVGGGWAEYQAYAKAANIVSSGIQPFQNFATLKYIEEKFGPDEDLSLTKHHITKGFAALEKLLKGHAGRYATGDEVFLADLFLAPQLYGSIKWFNVDMTQFPLLSRLDEEYDKIPAFQDAMPENQPDNPAASAV